MACEVRARTLATIIAVTSVFSFFTAFNFSANFVVFELLGVLSRCLLIFFLAKFRSDPNVHPYIKPLYAIVIITLFGLILQTVLLLTDLGLPVKILKIFRLLRPLDSISSVALAVICILITRRIRRSDDVETMYSLIGVGGDKTAPLMET